MLKRLAIGLGAVALAGLLWWLMDRERQLPAADPRPLRLSAVPAEVLHFEAPDIVRRGSPNILILRFDGPVEMIPHHYAQEGLPEPLTIEEWRARLDTPLVFNAGQFDEHLNHLGWLKSAGRWIVPHKHATYNGVLLTGPVQGGPWGRVADLKYADPSVEQRYLHAVQSMMLVEDDGTIRVRDTDRTACRTVVAEDRQGRLSIIITEGAVTLGDLARWLHSRKELDIVRAMNLDGGIEAQLAVRSPELELTFYGQYGTGTTVIDNVGGTIKYPLPAVIAVRPIRQAEGMVGDRL